MSGETTNGMQCMEFDALLGDALDGLLTGVKLESFQAHARVCPACGPLLTEAEAGRTWLKSLAEVEPPANLVHNILAATTGIDTARLRATPAAPLRATWRERAQSWLDASLAPVWATVRQPRFAMSFGMAFFSLSVALSLAGVKPEDIRHVDLRPAAVRRTYYTAKRRVVKYYENVQFVYEMESRLREFRRATEPAEPGPKQRNKEHNRNNTSGQPDLQQERNYSQSESQPVLASTTPTLREDNVLVGDDPPVVTATAYRRFV